MDWGHTTRTATFLLVATVVGWTAGCGTIKGRIATDQLLVSDAVDKSIAQINFDQLTERRVYLDTQYLKPVRTVGFVNTEYIISSLRERMLRANCKLQERPTDADYIVEVRVGALGTDGHEVNYGVPGSQALNQTASLITSAPLMPSIPEISLAKRDERRAAAKIAVFAYHRETKEPIWETGSIQGVSLAKSTWVLGAGPFHKGSIYESSELATNPIDLPSSQMSQPLLALFQFPWRRPVRALAAPAEFLAEMDTPPQLRPTPSRDDNGQEQLAHANAADAGRPPGDATTVVQATAIEPTEAVPPAGALPDNGATTSHTIGHVDACRR